ncbi:MAG: GyrI-like domain-containing protein [Hyphomicrobiales bacterium]
MPHLHITMSQPMILAGRNGTFAIGPSPGIRDLWEKFMADFGKITGQVNAKAYGVAHAFDGKGQMDYMAAVEVHDAGEVANYLHTLSIPARKIAVFSHEGDIAKISATWQKIFENWIPAAKLTVAPGPQLEVYDFSADDGPGTVEIHSWGSIRSCPRAGHELFRQCQGPGGLVFRWSLGKGGISTDSGGSSAGSITGSSRRAVMARGSASGVPAASSGGRRLAAAVPSSPCSPAIWAEGH